MATFGKDGVAEVIGSAKRPCPLARQLRGRDVDAA